LDKAGVIRGAYTLVFQRFLVGGVPEEVAFLQIPISEGTVNRSLAAVGAVLLRDALQRSPLLFGLGMGGIDRPLPKLFGVLGASMFEVPFFFRVVHPRAFLRHATALRTRWLVRVCGGIAAETGAGAVAFALLNRLRSRNAVPKRDLRVESAASFREAADEIWNAAAPKYSCISVRDSETLSYLYALNDSRYHRLVVHQHNSLVGWALVTDSQMRSHNHFGDMRVGAIVNCLARPDSEAAVVASASYYLQSRGVDLIVSNQFHPDWASALSRAGYLSYRSNFALALAPALSAKIKTQDPLFQRIHMNRGDGDGAYNL